MADKLGESAWTGFTKDLAKKHKIPKLDLEDKKLLDALKALARTDEDKPGPHLAALGTLIDQINQQVVALGRRKKELGDAVFKEAKDHLHGMLDLAETQRKNVQAAEQKSSAKGGDGGDDEEESPALLTTKMVPLLRELRKGEAVMPALIALAGKETVVLVSRRAISPARGKLLKEQMEKPAGLKFIRADCQYERNALTFVVQSPAAALAKRLREALLAQTQMRWKVRVRGEDGVVEEDGDDDAQATPDGDPPVPQPPEGGPPSPEQLAYGQRLRKLQARYDDALRAQHPESTRLRAIMGLASERADEQKNYTGALQALQALEKLLDAGTGTGTGTGTETGKTKGGADDEAAFKARLTAQLPLLRQAQAANPAAAEQARLKISEAGTFARKRDFARAHGLLDEVDVLLAPAPTVEDEDEEPWALAEDFDATWRRAKGEWQAALETIDGQLERLRGHLQDSDDTDLRAIADRGLNAITADLRVPLQAALMDVDRTSGPARIQAIDKALDAVGAFLDHIERDERVEACDANPFGVQVTLRAELSQGLSALATALDDALV